MSITLADTPITLTYHIYKHKDNEECVDNVTETQAINDKNNDPTEPIPCVNPDCSAELIHDYTHVVDNTFPLIDTEKETRIDELSTHERTVLLGMLLQSLSRNWGNIESRLGMIGYICNMENGTELSPETLHPIREACLTLYTRNQLPPKTHDGRRFRGNGDGTFNAVWKHTNKTKDELKKLRHYIPNDTHWTKENIESLHTE